MPIAHALAYPERIESGVRTLDLGAIGNLSFYQPEPDRFPCLGLAYAALRAGGTVPAVLNAANEIAVEAFLAGRLRFTAIAHVIDETLQRVSAGAGDTLEALLDADRRARRAASEFAAAVFGNAA